MRLESPPLIFGIVEFAEAVGNFHLPGVNFETLRPLRFIRFLLRERRHRGGELVDDCRLREMLFRNRFEQTGNCLAQRLVRIVRHMRVTRVESLHQHLYALSTRELAHHWLRPGRLRPVVNDRLAHSHARPV